MMICFKLNSKAEKYDLVKDYLEEAIYKLASQKAFKNVRYYNHNGLIAFMLEYTWALPVIPFGVVLLASCIIFGLAWPFYLIGAGICGLGFFQSKTYLLFKISSKIKKLGYQGQFIRLNEEEFLKNDLNSKWDK